jgi:lipopolysaccharide transport protein LptA
LLPGVVLLSGCAGRKNPQSRAQIKEQARQIIKQTAQSVVVQVSKGVFQAQDSQGRLVMVARIKDADATLQPSDPSQGPVMLNRADLTLYKEGKPSLWLKAPVAAWNAGLLTAPHGADSGSLDGKITLHGKQQVTWTAKSDLLSVSKATCELREPGRPTLLAQGPTATWQNGLLTLPSGGSAHAADGSASMRADQVRWRAKTHGLQATGRVRMTQGRLAGAAERLTGDTTLRQFRLTGGRPRLTFYHQPAPLVAAAVAAEDRASAAPLQAMSRRDRTMVAQASLPGEPEAEPPGYRERTPLKRAGEPCLLSPIYGGSFPVDAGFSPRTRPAPTSLNTRRVDPRRTLMPISRPWLHVTLASTTVLLAAFPAPAAPVTRQRVTLITGETIEANDIYGTIGTVAHARGRVVMTGAPGTGQALYADQVDVTQSKPAGSSRSVIQEARANGHVRITSQPKPDERMEATGAAGTYWPVTQKAALTGGVTVTMTSSRLQEPAVMTGSRADIDLAQRAADVTRTESAQVSLKLHPKADASSSGSTPAGPVRLDADRVRMENATNRVTATGSPVLTGDQGTVRAEKIWFDVDPKANDIKMVHAAGSVHIDSQDAQGGIFHGTADEGAMDQATNTVVLTGNVHGTHTRPEQPQPETLDTDELTYNRKTGDYSMGSVGEGRSHVTIKPNPKLPSAAGAGTGAPPATPTKGKRARRAQ